jgi:hypothetical protein
MEKVKSLFHARKDASPMFNQPLNTTSCPHHRISRVLYSILLSLLIAIAIPVITLKTITYIFIEDNRETGFMFDTRERDGQPVVQAVMASLPQRLYTMPAKLALIAAAISLCLATAHLGFVGVDWKNGKRVCNPLYLEPEALKFDTDVKQTQSYAFRRNIMFLHIINAIIVLFALVSIYATRRSTSHFRTGYAEFRATHLNDTASNEKSFFRYNIGRFDLETWACELKDERGADERGADERGADERGADDVHEDYDTQCKIEVAGRAVMVPFFVVAWLVAGVGIWGLVGGGRRGPDGERMKTEDVGLEMGKMNATD